MLGTRSLIKKRRRGCIGNTHTERERAQCVHVSGLGQRAEFPKAAHQGVAGSGHDERPAFLIGRPVSYVYTSYSARAGSWLLFPAVPKVPQRQQPYMCLCVSVCVYYVLYTPLILYTYISL
jgi:hypothetical protein